MTPVLTITPVASMTPVRSQRPGTGLRRLTLAAEGLALFGIAFGTAFVLRVWSDPERVATLMKASLHGAPVAIDNGAWIMTGVLAIISLILFGWAMWEARALFRTLGAGDFFASDVPRRLTRLGYLGLAGSLGGIVMRTLMEFISTIHVAPEPQLSIAITSADYVCVIAALLLIVFARVMHEARRIADENQGFV